MRACIVATVLFLVTSICSVGQNVPALTADSAQTTCPDKQCVLLSEVIAQVENALDTYQQSQEVENKVLPNLQTADFDFKTVVDSKVGVGVSFFIFKIGYTHDKQSVNEVDFQYKPKSAISTDGKNFLKKKKAGSFQKELLETLKAAANAIQTQRNKPLISKDPLIFQQATVTISFGVTDDVQGGVTVPYLITGTGSLEGSKASTQQVKLSFSPPPPKIPSAMKNTIHH